MAQDEYATVVVCFPDGEGRKEFFEFIHDRFPMMADSGPRATMIGEGDCVSPAEAAAMALESDELDRYEKLELAQELLAAINYEECQKIFAKWEVEPDGRGGLRDTAERISA